jgi:hypothetical protein
MAFEKRNNSGAIFNNQYKQRDNQPDMTGNGLIDGVEYRMSGWKKEGNRGEYISLSFTRVDEMGQRASAPEAASSQSKTMTKAPQKKVVEDEIDDEIPF